MSFDAVAVASALVAGFGGFFLGRLLATRLVGGCLLLVGGGVALVALARLLLGGRVTFLDAMIDNLSGIVAGQLLAVGAFVLGFVAGVARRRRS